MTMKRVGSWLMWLGIASVAGKLVGLDVFLLIWLDSWGNVLGWLLRFGVVGLGYYWYRTAES
jgi:hypothetical protein